MKSLAFDYRIKIAPDIKSEVYFPALGDQANQESEPKGAWGKKL